MGANEIKAETNLLKNTSFKKCHNGQIPDFWCVPFDLPAKMEDWYSRDVIGIDDSVVPPVNDVRVLKFKKYYMEKNNEVYNYFGIPSYLRKMSAGEYTFSAYMKTENPEMEVEFASAYWGGRRAVFKVGKEWQRFECKFEFDGKKFFELKLNPLSPGTLYLAAPQLEKGGPATPYNNPEAEAKIMFPLESANVSDALAIPLTGESPVIDGKTGDDEWKNAKKLSGFKKAEGGTPAQATEVYIMRSEKAVYIAYKCFETDTNKLSLSASVGNDNPEIFGRDTVETFIVSGDEYYHFVTGRGSEKYESKGRADVNWNCNWKAAAGVGKDYWTVEMEIPFSGLALDKNSSKINFCRGRPGEKGPEYSAWKMTHGGFHNLKDCVSLDISGGGDTNRYCWELTEIGLVKSAARIFLNAVIDQKPANVKEIIAKVKIGGLGEFCGKPVVLERLPQRINVEINIPEGKKADDLAQIPVEIQLLDPRNQELLKSEIVRLPLEAMEPEAQIEYDYYTDDKTARFKIKNIKEDIAAINALVDDKKIEDKEIKFDKQTALSGDIILSMPINDLAPGTSKIAVDLLDKDKKTIYSFKQDLHKFSASKNKDEIRINYWKKCLAINKQPYLPIYFHSGIEDFKQEWLLKDVREHGFNAIFVWVNIYKPEDFENVIKSTEELLDMGKKYDFKVILCVGNYASWLGTPKRPFSDLKSLWTDFVNRLKTNPQILAWNITDEPSKDNWEKERGFAESDLVALHDAVKSADPYHPAFVNWCSLWSRSAQPYGSYACTDIVSYDQYPFAVCGGMHEGPKALSLMCNYVNMLNSNPGWKGPTMFWVQSYGGLYDGGVEPSPEELQCMVFQNLIAGTRIYGYYGTRAMYEPQWIKQKEINETARKIAKNILLHDDSEKIYNGQYKNVMYSLWRVKKTYYLIAVNYGNKDTRFRFGIESYIKLSNGNASMWFGAGAPVIKDGTLTDDFSPLQAKIIKIGN